MVFDTLSRCTAAGALLPRLEDAIAFLKETDFSKLENGRHEIGGGMYFLVQRYETKSGADAKFEAHRSYADLQYIVSGHERMACCDLADARPLSPFSEEKDCGKYTAAGPCAEFCVGPGQFALFLPHDCHKPSFHADGEPPCAVVKVVVKLPVQ